MVDYPLHKAKIEALLFAHGEPISLTNLAQALGLRPEEVRDIMNTWSLSLATNPESGLCIIAHNDAYQLVTKQEYGPLVEDFMKKDFSQELSPAALETLTIILYRGPLSRSEIDYIRGVNSSFMVRTLLLRSLVERIADTKSRHFFVYQASFSLLRLLGIQSPSELPDYEELQKKYEDILAHVSSESQNNPETDA